jgi:hypothetical protein
MVLSVTLTALWQRKGKVELMANPLSRVTLELPVVEEIVIDPLQQQLATKAKDLLGYGLLEECIQGGVAEEVQKRTDHATLAQIFNKLDIHPLDPKEVERHQRKERSSLNRKAILSLPGYAQLFMLLNAVMEKGFSFLKLCDTTLRRGVVAMFTILTLIGAIIDLVCLLCHSWIAGMILAPCTLMWLCIVYCIALLKRCQELTLQMWSWKKLTFAECYKEKVEIPEFALDTATRIKEHLPGANLFVEAVISDDQVLGDPFLCLEYGGVKHYLEVWDESRFERMTTRKV